MGQVTTLSQLLQTSCTQQWQTLVTGATSGCLPPSFPRTPPGSLPLPAQVPCLCFTLSTHLGLPCLPSPLCLPLTSGTLFCCLLCLGSFEVWIIFWNFRFVWDLFFYLELEGTVQMRKDWIPLGDGRPTGPQKDCQVCIRRGRSTYGLASMAWKQQSLSPKGTPKTGTLKCPFWSNVTCSLMASLFLSI